MSVRALLVKMVRQLIPFLSALLLLAQTLSGCENVFPNHLGSEPKSSEKSPKDEQGESVKPPFDVRGELEGLLVVWIDKDGFHSANKRSEIPENRRQQVRVDSLALPPDKRLDGEFVYLADLRKAQNDGNYPVKKVRRDWFEALADRETPDPARAAKNDSAKKQFGTEPGAAGSGVVIYGASWCGACRAAASYLRARNIAFEEKDVEKDREAYAQMQRKAAAAGVQPGGLPLIDFHGRVISGFSKDALDNLIERGNR
jgi:glutaredoxin